MKDLSQYRSEFPITNNYCFLNNAAISAPPLRVAKAVNDLMLQFGNEGFVRYPEWMKTVDRTRSLFARLINADPSEVCFTANTSEALSIVAGGISWKRGDKIIVPIPDFPSNVYPWVNLERAGVEICFVRKNEGRFGLSDIKAVLRPGTRLIAVSSTDFTTGFRCDLEELGDFCRQNAILLCVDAIQSLGAIPLDVKSCGVHFLACGGHKWLLSTMGIGALYISKEVNDLLHPIRVGWRSVENEEDFYNLESEIESRCPPVRSRDPQPCRNHRSWNGAGNAARNRDRAHIRKDIGSERRNLIGAWKEEFPGHQLDGAQAQVGNSELCTRGCRETFPPSSKKEGACRSKRKRGPALTSFL